MRVAIFGSFKLDKDGSTLRGSRNEFATAARQLGALLAAHEHTIIAGSTEATTFDRHVVDGFFAVAARRPGTRARIEVVRPRSDRETVAYEAYVRAHPHLFIPHPPTEDRWSGAHLTTVEHADVAITMGGGKSTYYAGVATLLARKPLIPIASFGGASFELLKLTLQTLEKSLRQQFFALSNPWSDHTARTALRAASLDAGPKLLLIHGRGDDWRLLRDWLIEREKLSGVIVLREVFAPSEPIFDKFERLALRVHGAIALATPDDWGALATSRVPAYRARQNVWVEVGWFWGRLGRERLIVLRRGEVEIPSDLGGVEVSDYVRHPGECADRMRQFIDTIS